MGRAPAPEPVGPPIDEFVRSKHYLNIPYFSDAQIAVLKAIYGLPLTRDERLAFLELSEGREPNPKGYEDVVMVVGTRAGKSQIGAIIATYEAVRWGPVLSGILAPGQTARAILIAENKKQAGEVRGYIEGNIATLENPACGHDCHWNGGILAKTEGQERAITGEAVKLRWPVEFYVYPANKAGVRGATGLCAVLDEIAYWQCGEGAYNQDTKIMRAVRSRFATLAALKPKKVIISSPDEEVGVLWDEYSKRATSKALVVKCPTWVFNPNVDQDFLDREQEKDAEDFATEYGAEFRKPGGGNVFLPAEIVEQCIDRERLTNPYKATYDYIAWMDAGFKQDPFAFGIGHAESDAEGTRAIVDHVQRWVPPKRKGAHLDPDEIIPEMVAVLKAYGIDKVRGDQFSDVTLKGMLERSGIKFIESPASNTEKTEAFKNFRGGLRAGLVELPDFPPLILELKALVKKTTSGGHVHIAAPTGRNAHDDMANVVARIVNQLLPAFALDLAALNAKAMPQRRQDWRSEEDKSGLDTGDMLISDGGESPFASVERVTF
jgi:hypothetical protein